MNSAYHKSGSSLDPSAMILIPSKPVGRLVQIFMEIIILDSSLIGQPMHTKLLDAITCCVLDLSKQTTRLPLELRYLQDHLTMADSLILA
ncbi:hypothetical protein OIU77_000461 [Salix suchowensis]|uniref:Uncharacterized protein n=1 Tax=Salix suchowensis TaxID=1278906 RepID=A0ABQ9B8H5_9ROSI|nr:hypothetical protein OIU77_000461 [Salix suchowensis]